MKLKTLPTLLSLSVASAITFAEDSEKEIEETFVLGQDLASISQSASRLDLSLHEIPATVEEILGDAIRYRRDLSVLKAVSRSAGLVGAGNPGNGGTSLTARGFTGQDAVAKLYDGNQYFTLAGTNTFPFDTWAIDRIEVLKGPASVLYGQGGVAGAINVVPKAPSSEFGANLRLTAGENSERFFGAGVTGEIIDSLNGRADYSRGESDNWVENGESETEMLALALEWEATEDLSFTLRHDEGDQSPLRYFGIPIVDGDFNEDWVELNLNVGDSRIRYQDAMTRLITDWSINDSLALNAEVFSIDSDRYWQTVETYSYDAENDLINRFDPLIIRHELEQTGLRANLVIDSMLAEMPLKTSVGFELTDIAMDYTSNFNPTHPNRVDWGGDFDTVDPNNFQAGSWSDVTDSSAALDQVSDADQMAFFAEAHLKVTDVFAVLAGVRLDTVETEYERLTYDEDGNPDTSGDNLLTQDIDPLMFRLGGVYDINEDTATYAQYSTGETHPNGGDILRVRSNFREAETVSIEQFEIGIKQSLLDERLTWSMAVFDITKKDLLIDDPDSSDPTDVVSIPEQTSQGIEASVSYVLSNSFTGYANVAYVDAERGTGEETIPTPYVADVTFNTGLLYSPVEFIRLGADLQYVDERPYEDTPLPSYTLVDLSLAWIVNKNTSVIINAINVTDELFGSSDHWTGGQWSVGQPQTVSLTLDFSF